MTTTKKIGRVSTNIKQQKIPECGKTTGLLTGQFYLSWISEGSVNPYFSNVKRQIEEHLNEKATTIQKNFRGYFVRKLVKETLSCGFCTKFKPKLTTATKQDILASKIADQKFDKIHEKQEIIQKMRNFEFLENNEKTIDVSKLNRPFDILDNQKKTIRKPLLIDFIKGGRLEDGFCELSKDYQRQNRNPLSNLNRQNRQFLPSDKIKKDQSFEKRKVN